MKEYIERTEIIKLFNKKASNLGVLNADDIIDIYNKGKEQGECDALLELLKMMEE